MSTAGAGARSGPAWVGVIFLTLMLGVLANHLTGDDVGSPGLATIALIAAVVAMPRCRGITLCMSVALLAAGVGLAAAGGMWREWLIGTTALGSVLALVTFAQLFAEPIEIGGYSRELVRAIEARARFPAARAQVAVLASFLLSCLAAGGALAATLRALVRPEDDEAVRATILRSAMRGTGAAIGLTPITGVFGATMTVTGLTAVSLFVLALPAAAVTLALALAVSLRSRVALLSGGERAPDWRRLGHLGLGVIGLVLSILAFEAVPNVDPVDAIAISLVLVAVAWGTLLDRRAFLPRLRSFPSRIVTAISPSVALFVFGGALASVLASSGWANDLLSSVLAVPSGALAVFVVGGIVWLLFHLGIHPAVAVILVAPAALGGGMVRPDLFGFAVLAASGVSVISSPFGMVSHLAAALSGRSVFEIGVVPHVAFGLVSLALSLSLMTLLLA